MFERGILMFERALYRKFKKWIPKRKIRISFEREQPTIRDKPEDFQNGSSKNGNQRKKWRAYPLPSKVLSYVKKTRKPKSQ